jgi:flagellar biosynthesis/type III secretory pathway protein FliH
VTDDFVKMFEPSTAKSVRTPESEGAMQRFVEAQDARAAQAEAADEDARSFIETLADASNDVRSRAALAIAEGYEEARALTLREMELMVAEMTARIPDYRERQIEITRSYQGYDLAGLPLRYIRAAAEWRKIADFERLRP